jgi:hypothetical protein
MISLASPILLPDIKDPQFWTMSASVAAEDVTLNILKYAFNELIQLPGFARYGQIKDTNGLMVVPIYPVTNAGVRLPETSIPDELTIIYDDFIKARSGEYKYFYPIKGVQSRFKVTTDDYAVTRIITNRLVEIIDREDEAASDINGFMRQYYGGNHRIMLHCVNAYQTVYLKDATTLDDQRLIFSQDIIIKADYHMLPINSKFA